MHVVSDSEEGGSIVGVNARLDVGRAYRCDDCEVVFLCLRE